MHSSLPCISCGRPSVTRTFDGYPCCPLCAPPEGLATEFTTWTTDHEPVWASLASNAAGRSLVRFRHIGGETIAEYLTRDFLAFPPQRGLWLMWPQIALSTRDLDAVQVWVRSVLMSPLHPL